MRSRRREAEAQDEDNDMDKDEANDDKAMAPAQLTKVVKAPVELLLSLPCFTEPASPAKGTIGAPTSDKNTGAQRKLHASSLKVRGNKSSRRRPLSKPGEPL